MIRLRRFDINFEESDLRELRKCIWHGIEGFENPISAVGHTLKARSQVN